MHHRRQFANMNRYVRKMSMAPASVDGNIHQKTLNMQCIGIVTLSRCDELEAWTAVVRHILGTHRKVNWHRVRVAKVACVFEILSKESVKININA